MKKLRRFLKVLVVIVSTIFVFWLVVGLIPAPKSTENNEWLKERMELNRSLISAHRGGAELNPENTEMAFDYIVEHDLADIIEIDIRVTKDNKLVIMHDDTIDRVAKADYKEKKANDESYKGTVFVRENNYEDLLQYNLGKNFLPRELKGTSDDVKGPYYNLTTEEADQLGLTIMLLEEFLEKYKNDDVKVLIEIKDKEELANFAADETIKLLDGKYNSWKKNAMIISFTDSVINYIAEEYPDQLIGALGYNILPEIATHTLGLHALYKANYTCIQTKMVNTAGPLKITAATKEFVKQAHDRNQTIAFWTINKPEDMDVCIEIGADIITTDAPDILASKLNLL